MGGGGGGGGEIALYFVYRRQMNTGWCTLNVMKYSLVHASEVIL